MIKSLSLVDNDTEKLVQQMQDFLFILHFLQTLFFSFSFIDVMTCMLKIILNKTTDLRQIWKMMFQLMLSKLTNYHEVRIATINDLKIK